MLVVSNTSPISNLALIGRLDLLRCQMGEVWIPSAVRLEILDLPDTHARAAIQLAIQEGWLRGAEVTALELLKLLSTTLHPGESEAIALAVQLHAGLVLIDEREARGVAALLNLRVTGVLGVLLRAKREGAVASLRQEIEALRAEARFFVAPQLEHRILHEAGE
jgi:predicted nucleic acid-binding protein